MPLARPTRRALALVALAWPALAGPTLAAGTVEIVPAAYLAAGCIGSRTCTVAGAELSAGPAPDARFARQDFAAVVGLGVAATDTGADRDDEIQGPVDDRGLSGESVTVTFAAPHRVGRIVLAHLYNPEMPGDPPETAIIEGFRAGESLGQLRLTSINDESGAFRLAGDARIGAVRRLDTRAGQYVLFEPFGTPVDRVVFSAPAVPSGDTSDYSLVSLAARPAD